MCVCKWTCPIWFHLPCRPLATKTAHMAVHVMLACIQAPHLLRLQHRLLGLAVLGLQPPNSTRQVPRVHKNWGAVMVKHSTHAGQAASTLPGSSLSALGACMLTRMNTRETVPHATHSAGGSPFAAVAVGLALGLEAAAGGGLQHTAEGDKVRSTCCSDKTWRS